MLQKSEELELREAFLSAMRNVANSVSIVSTSGPAGLGGATVSSVCSVSADPPTMLACLNKMAATADLVIRNQQFAISILPENGQEIADAFAVEGSDKSSLLQTDHWKSEEGFPPILKNCNAFICSVREIAEATSHYVLIGDVVHVQQSDRTPLVYLNRQYRRISDRSLD